MEVEKIDRINALAHKAKSVGLTEEEKKERELLRKEYIASVRMNLRAQLDNVDVQQEDGTRTGELQHVVAFNETYLVTGKEAGFTG